MLSPKFSTLIFASLAFILFAPQILLAQYAISTVAGGGPTGITALNASVGNPAGIAIDSLGNTFIADPFSSHIFEVDTAGNLTVVAGNGTFGYSGDNGLATSATLNRPAGVFVDGSGNIFIADTDNCLVREVSGGTISTVAGSAVKGCGYGGDGGPASGAQLYDPSGVFVDSSENIFIADTDNCLVREVSGGTITTVAGADASSMPCGYNGDGAATSAQLAQPEGLFVAEGGIFIADTDNNLIRVANPGTTPITIAGISIPAGELITVAGTYYNSDGGTACGYLNDGQIATTAQLCAPAGVFVDITNNVFIADTNNFAIREIAASTINIITTPAGTLGTQGYNPTPVPATTADLNYPSNMAVDSLGNIWVADTLNSVIRVVNPGASSVTVSGVTIPPTDIQTVIGNNTLAYSGDNGLAVDAELFSPGAVAADSLGDVFIADTSNNLIRVANTGTTANTIAAVTIQPGDIQTVAGSYYVPAGDALCDYSGDGGAPTSAQLCSPSGVFLDSSANIFIADTQNNSIRVVNTQTVAITIAGVTIQPNTIATVAGTGTLCSGVATQCGDGGAATSAELANPYGVFVDSGENIFIADTDDYVVREVTGSSGVITTVAGNYAQCTPLGATLCGDGAAATSAQLGFPTSVFVDGSENVFIADAYDNRIRAVNTQTAATTIAGVTIPPSDIATVAGTGVRGYAGDDAAATSAQLDTPFGVFVDSSGDIFIADTENFVIREVVAATANIQTVAGNNTPGFSGDGLQSTTAQLNFPSGLFGSSTGNLFIADTDNQRIRELTPAIFVTVTPSAANVAVSTQAQFTATVSAPTGDTTAVTWQVNSIVGGNSTIGTISTTGLFQAPATIPTPATVTITAISQADNTTSASAQATIVPTGDAVTVTVTTNPSVAQVYTTTTQVFIATVTGTTNTAVTWQVNEVTGGNATVGTIDASGNYTAPASVPNPATVTIEAVSQAVSSAIGTESVLIVTNPSAAPPTPQTIAPGAAATYSLLLNENAGWTGGAVTLSCKSSTLPPGATCGFASQAGAPITTITPGAQAVPFTLTINVPSGSAALVRPAGMRPQIYFAFAAFVPLAGILLAGIGRRNNRRHKRQRWLWLAGLCVVLVLLNACGGGGSGSSPQNPELGTYNVKVLGTTSAQPNPVTITTAGLTVAQ